MDGGLTDNTPVPLCADEVPSLVLHPYLWRSPEEEGFPFVRVDGG